MGEGYVVRVSGEHLYLAELVEMKTPRFVLTPDQALWLFEEDATNVMRSLEILCPELTWGVVKFDNALQERALEERDKLSVRYT